MYFRSFTFWFICNLFWNESLCANSEGVNFERSKSSDNLRTSAASAASKNDLLFDTCTMEDFQCLAVAASDRLGLEAIKSLHQKLDDDANGNIDLSESDDFLREDLQFDSGDARRQSEFHRMNDKNNDKHISVKELWESWLKSEVHNWTTEQTTEWLISSVQLPQYVDLFVQNKVIGAHLPRMAVHNNNYLGLLGIKDPIHKQKLSLKAMDVVLFGPPKDGQPHWKDMILIILLIGGGIGSWYAVQQNKKFKNHLNRMNKDMDYLQNAEKALESLQKELSEARQAQESVISEKEILEKKLQKEPESLTNSFSDLEVSQLKSEIEMLKHELQIAEGELKDKCWGPPLALQQWLQMTYELENKQYFKKKIAAEKQLQQAREACEKLRKKRSSLVGAFVSTHGKSIDDVDRSIVEARTALNEVTQELQEKMTRWKQIEMLCGFNIMNNNGYQYLENALYNRNSNGRLKGRMSSQDDLDEDTGSVYGSHPGQLDIGTSTPVANISWKENDSSESEVSKQEDDSLSEHKSNSVHFTLGDESSRLFEDVASANIPHHQNKVTPNPRSISNNNIVMSLKTLPPITRSQSHETNMALVDTLSKTRAHSDNSLEQQANRSSALLRPSTIQEQPSVSVEDDICSTDSSVIDEDHKKKKKRLFTFSKKSKRKD